MVMRIPFSMEEKTVARTATHQMTNPSGEILQNMYTCGGDATRSATACMVIANNPVFGPVEGVHSTEKATMTTMPVKHPEA
jgi:hypothetical protein